MTTVPYPASAKAEPAAVIPRFLSLLRPLLLVVVANSLCSCSMLLVHSTRKYPPLESGTSRQQIVKVLKEPQKSITYQPSRSGATLPHAPAELRSAKVARYDEYSVSGLVAVPGDTLDRQFAQYPLGFIFTGGTTEAYQLPLTAAQLAVASVQRYRLGLWYDPSLKLLTYEHRKRSILP